MKRTRGKFTEPGDGGAPVTDNDGNAVGIAMESDPMKRYESRDDEDSPGHTPVYRVDGDNDYEIDKRLDLRSHSPSGFSWGYRGSGPHQLALAILADAYDDEYAVENYREYCKKVVSRLDDNVGFVAAVADTPPWWMITAVHGPDE